MRIFAYLVALLGACPALACIALPMQAARDHGPLVDEASSIVLLEVVGSGQSCSLKVVGVLKGRVPESVPVECRLPEDGDWMTNFSNHSDENFWNRRHGRLGINGDCSVIPPAFSLGKTYLALLGIEPDTKQFEEIGDDDDRWLAFVIARVQGEE